MKVSTMIAIATILASTSLATHAHISDTPHTDNHKTPFQKSVFYKNFLNKSRLLSEAPADPVQDYESEPVASTSNLDFRWELSAIWQRKGAYKAMLNQNLVSKGSKVDGYTVTSISAEKVTLRGPNYDVLTIP